MGTKIGLALSGGGARGFAHLGVIKALTENDIPIEVIVGTSAGSFAAGAFAAGMSVAEMLAMAREIGWRNIGKPSFSLKGLIDNAPIGEFIKQKFPATRIEDMKIPFAAIATDLETGSEVVFKEKGDITFAIRASCAFPGVFAPLSDEKGRLIVDGGAVAPIPTLAARGLGAEVVIGVDLLSCGQEFNGSPWNAMGVLFRAGTAMMKNISRKHHAGLDLVIEPKIARIRPDQINKREDLIRLGEDAAHEKLSEIKRLLD
jgi:NTE family protein